MIIRNFLRAAVAIGISSLLVFTMASGHLPTSKHYRAMAQLFTPVK
ncbi:MAG: hypothetical protein JST83_11695 [Bacteroidetes bacterium]|nr:hypothetical protein [Bacteroidota bacterium]